MRICFYSDISSYINTAHQQEESTWGNTRWDASAGRAVHHRTSSFSSKLLWSSLHESLFVRRVLRSACSWKKRCRVLDMESAVWYCAGKEAELALCGSWNIWPCIQNNRNVSLPLWDVKAITVWDSYWTFWFSCLFLRYAKSLSLRWEWDIATRKYNLSTNFSEFVGWCHFKVLLDFCPWALLGGSVAP